MRLSVQVFTYSLLVLFYSCTKRSSTTIRSDYFEGSPSYSLFKKDIIPIIENRCSVRCHGIEEREYEQFMRKPGNGMAFYVPFDYLTGKIPRDKKAVQEVFRVVTQHSSFSKKPKQTDLVHSANEGSHRIDYQATAEFSPFLRYPLAEEFGGVPHRGLDVFYSTDDPDYQKMRDWIQKEIQRVSVQPVKLSDAEEYFKKNVLSSMVRKGCFLAACHGPNVFNDLKLQPPLPMVGANGDLSKGFSDKMVLANHKALLGAKSRLVNFFGDLKKSRLIAKNIPLSIGGVHHKGGNNQFFQSFDDLDLKTVLTWMEMEREQLIKSTRSQGEKIKASEIGQLKGIVFIRGPRHTPRSFFDIDKYYPGSEIYLQKLKGANFQEKADGVPIQISRKFLETAQVEIQSLDVRYDGRAIVFSMRKGKEEGFRLYQITLDAHLNPVSFDQVSYASKFQSSGDLIHHIDPIYSPGPHDEKGVVLDDVAISFASNEAGEYANTLPLGFLGKATGGEGRVLLDERRPEKEGTYTGYRIHILDGSSSGAWRNIIRHEKKNGAGAGFELDHSVDNKTNKNLVYVIQNKKPDVKPSYDIWRTVPTPGELNEKGFRKTARRMTFSPANERAPTMRTTGEVMFTSVRNDGYQEHKPVYNGAIYRVQTGGFDYHIHGGNRSRYPLFLDSREVPEGLEIRQGMDPRNLWGGGALFMVDHGFGVNVEPGNPIDISNVEENEKEEIENFAFSNPPKYVPASFPLKNERGIDGITYTGESLGGSFKNAYPLGDQRILVSFTKDKIDHLDPNQDPNWDIYMVRFKNSLEDENAKSIGAYDLSIISNVSTSGYAEYSPRPIIMRQKEKPRTEQKFDRNTSPEEVVTEFGVKRVINKKSAEVECYDFPLLQSFVNNLSTSQAKDFRIAHGNPNGIQTEKDRQFKYVRIITQEAQTKKATEPFLEDALLSNQFGIGSHKKKKIVAEVPLEEDGSFYAQVPPNVPLIIQGLNKDKMAMQAMNRWFYVQPGEKLTFSIPRSVFPVMCAGCHGSLSGKPSESMGGPDIFSASSLVMATWNPDKSELRKPYGYGKVQKSAYGVDYLHDVKPILKKHCVGCHNSENAQGNVRLDDSKTAHYEIGYESLVKGKKQYVNYKHASSFDSSLFKIFKDKQHQDKIKFSPGEQLTIVRWIDLGAMFKGDQ